MRAFKGFDSQLTSVHGNRDKETTVFRIGETKRVETSKTQSSGFHCCEYPFHCCRHYSFDGHNRFFEVEASGDIDEAGDEKIACTEITILRELMPGEFLMEGMKYLIEHPFRTDWQVNNYGIIVDKGHVEANVTRRIVVSRDAMPEVTVAAGTLVGLIREPQEGDIEAVRMFKAKEAGHYGLDVLDRVAKV